ncbi:MAG: molybdopterin cofactor-binding domain-containing protein [Chloroflexota bacterium]|nr:molybdopterin cofactor-binding domain-containing protein [Chloroflexota bacterium]
MAYIGKSIPRVDVKAKATGESLYPGDFNQPDQVYMKILFAGRPHAVIKEIDTEAAETTEGVLAVLTAKDVPVNEYGLIIADQPVLCGPGSSKPFTDRVRFVGDQVALVIAETEEIAEKACSRIKLDYEDLPVVSSIDDALSDDAVLLHPDLESNNFCHYQIRHGDVDEAFKHCDVIVEGEYKTPVQEHIYLQPEAGFAYLDAQERITVVVAGQWTHEDREQIAHALDIQEEKVRVIYPAIGGAFGGREDMSVQIVLALAVMRLHDRGIDRPVKIVWSREESILGHHKRHAYRLKGKWGANKNGDILAADVKILTDGGAYIYTSTKVLANAILQCTGPYNIPNVRVDADAIYTNNIPGGAFRGFGGPQGAFEAEMQVTHLAEALGIDPVEFRMRNLMDDDSILSMNSKVPEGVTIKQVTAACAEHAGWQHNKTGWHAPSLLEDEGVVKRGRGTACAYKNVGFSYGAPESCNARIELFGNTEIERVVLHHAGADDGQGAHSVFKQFAAEALDIPLEKIELVVSDTALTGNSGSSSASRMTFMAGNSIKGAAKLALEKWSENQRPVNAEYVYIPPATTAMDHETGECVPNFSYTYVAETVELEVDTETGEIRLLKVYCAIDVGKAVNPVQVVGQIEGAIVQAAGYVLLENFIQQDGYVKTNLMSNYLIPTVLDIPVEVESIVLEFAEPNGPYGARGIGEMPFLPLAPAIMHALHDATGVWFHEFPLTPEKVLRGLGKLK